MHIDLSGKNILVTGATRGIGRALTEQLASSGANVAIHYHKNVKEASMLAEKLGSRAFQADLSDANEVSRLLQEVLTEMKTLDVLVNNAGIALSAPLSQPDDEWLASWDQTLNVNLKSAAFLCRKAIMQFLEQKTAGRIINISSRAAFRGDTPDYMAYAASKAGMTSLTKTIARGYGKQGVVAFVVAPGFVKTDMAQDFMDQYGEAHAHADIALDRLSLPEDLAPLVVFLASGLADHATGSTIDVNAGSYMH